MSAFQPVEALAHGVPLAVVYVTLTLIPELTLTLDELALILMTAAVVTTNVSPPPSPSSLLKDVHETESAAQAVDYVGSVLRPIQKAEYELPVPSLSKSGSTASSRKGSASTPTPRTPKLSWRDSIEAAAAPSAKIIAKRRQSSLPTGSAFLRRASLKTQAQLNAVAALVKNFEEIGVVQAEKRVHPAIALTKRASLQAATQVRQLRERFAPK